MKNGAEYEELIARAVDREHMLAVLQEILPPLAAVPIRVTACRVKTEKAKRKQRKGAGPIDVMYFITVESDSGESWAHTVLATLPVGHDHLGGELAERCLEASESTLARPFERLATYVPARQMEAHLLPVDLALPGLLEFTGPRRCETLARSLPECRDGATVDEVEAELIQYKRGARAVLRVRARLSGGASGPAQRAPCS